ncbi:1-propanol dehydrogenase PduQ [Clostridium uliginosum]|uniref:Acetaldehyde dehydrogenase / alcohol dehydrogenase n=1 Tax=Clostridium uliginosum TaxID=119641 RepID=A0A1I1H9X1_9CLOT|nr:1-propanol dehydrogenase PduQ [Clostridium uliginosum]SFC18808.1 acetaldehyde dehydrogenase / alcohol dehydrogenase [Clostridium uliginosum]
MKNFRIPTQILYEDNAIQYLEKLNSKGVFIVTDKVMFDIGVTDNVTNILEENSIKYEIFSEVQPEPTMEVVTHGFKRFLDYGGDTIIAVGGGSVIDASKAMIYFLNVLQKKVPSSNQQKPLFIAIPSTSGTGSEVTSYAVITDAATHTKIPLKSDEMYADVALLDWIFTKTVPPTVTADTALDVLTHALEAYVSVGSSDYTDALAKSAIETVFDYTEKVYKNGLDQESRTKIHNASCMAGIAFENAGLGINHSIAHTLGATFKITHGRANAILLPYVVEYNSSLFDENDCYDFKTAKRYSEIARLLGLPQSDFKEGVVMFVKALKALLQSVNIPLAIKDLGVDENAFNSAMKSMCETAMKDMCTLGNPRVTNEKGICSVLMKAYYGK